MARKTKEVVIEALRAIPDLEFDENGKYNELCKLLKAHTGPTVVKSCIGCVRQEVCHPNGVKFDSRLMASTCPEWEETSPSDPTGDTKVKETPNQLTIVNRIKKRNTFLGDSVRDERDSEFLNKEISQRKYKGKLLRTTRIKEYEVSDDGFWETKFIIDLKD